MRCGSIESVRRVLSKPRFEHPEALLIDVGLNDIENDKCDAKYIADNLISLAYQAIDLFPDTRVFLSEITPRMDGLNEKVIAMNKIIRNAPISNISVIVIKILTMESFMMILNMLTEHLVLLF